MRGIPEDLYDKAEDHQEELTEEERQLFLSRGDVIGKALGSPHSLTANPCASQNWKFGTNMTC